LGNGCGNGGLGGQRGDYWGRDLRLKSLGGYGGDFSHPTKKTVAWSWSRGQFTATKLCLERRYDKHTNNEANDEIKRCQNLQIFGTKIHKNEEHCGATKLWLERRYNKHTTNEANNENQNLRIFGEKKIKKPGALWGEEAVAGAGLQQTHNKRSER
jgi:hypothetical protein